jgi:hypothetical protein
MRQQQVEAAGVNVAPDLPKGAPAGFALTNSVVREIVQSIGPGRPHLSRPRPVTLPDAPFHAEVSAAALRERRFPHWLPRSDSFHPVPSVGRQLQNDDMLTRQEIVHQHDGPVCKFERVMMLVGLVLIDLAKSSQVLVNSSPENHTKHFDVIRKCDFGTR